MNEIKGIILAGGAGTRLYPLSKIVSKHLLPVYDKPMIYYPLSTLMLAGIRNTMVITTPHDHLLFTALLGDGSQWGINIRYAIQARPEGIAQAYHIARDFIQGAPSYLILGDNVFYGTGFVQLLQEVKTRRSGATLFSYWVKDPQRYGVVDFDSNGKVVSIVEKPAVPRSHFAVTGLYYYDEQVADMAQGLRPSPRGEMEITDINNLYLRQGTLRVERLGRGVAWLDTGTHEALMQAAQFIHSIQDRQGLMVSCPEEIAFRNGWIDGEQLLNIAHTMPGTDYGKYLCDLVQSSLPGHLQAGSGVA